MQLHQQSRQPHGWGPPCATGWQKQQQYRCHTATCAAKRPRDVSELDRSASQRSAWQANRRPPAKQPVEQAPQAQQSAHRPAQQAVQQTAAQPSNHAEHGAARQSLRPVSLQGNDLTRKVADLLQRELAGVGHMYVGSTAALLQGVQVPNCYTDVQVCVQWDNLQALLDRLSTQQQPTPVTLGPGQLGFTLQLQGVSVVCFSHQNTVVRMEPERVQVTHPATGRQYWCESLLSVRRGAPKDLAAAVDARLQQLQAELTASNAQAWSQSDVEGAWTSRLGSPEDTARWICQDPWLRLGRPLYKHLPQQLSGVRLINLMGSHGTKAIAAAVLGAQATCVDISPVNAAYGAKVAAAAGAQVDFVVADVLHLPPDQLTGAYDVVLLEMGVLHYFIDLTPLLTVVKQLLKPGGRLLLREFHPVSTKLIKDKANGFGNYFSQELVVSSVAYSKHSTPDHRHKRLQAADVGGGPCTRLRQWGLGEVVTAVCDSGLVLSCLEEGPTVKLADQGLPKLFTLVAVKSC